MEEDDDDLFYFPEEWMNEGKRKRKKNGDTECFRPINIAKIIIIILMYVK